MQNTPSRSHLPSVAQLILSICGLGFTLLSIGGIWALMKFGNSVTAQSFSKNRDVSVFIWSSTVIAFAAIPSFFFTLRRLSAKPIWTNIKNLNKFSLIGLFLFPVLLFIGTQPLFQKLPVIAVVLIDALVIALPLWGFVEMGRLRLPAGSPQRQWGLITFGTFFSMPLTIVLEIVVLVITVLFGFVWLLQQPGFSDLAAQFQGQLQVNPQQILSLSEKIQPYLKQPGVIVAGFFVISLFVPLIEELFKPLALWFFIKKHWTPAEGFVAGLICGAAFAFAESLASLASISANLWMQTALGRLGTGLLHTFTAGFSGWALTAAWQDGKYIRIALVYLSNVLIHGVWNFFAILFGISPFLQTFSLPSGNGISTAAPWILVLLAAFMFSGLISLNHKLQAESTPPELPLQPPELIV